MKAYLAALIVFSFWASAQMLTADSSESAERAGARDAPLRVLVLFSNQRTLPANIEIQLGLWSSLGPAINSYEIELFEEYLEAHRLSVGDNEPAMIPYLRERYKEMTPDVVVSLGTQAVAFSEQWMDAVFPEAIRVFGVVREDELEALQLRKPLAGLRYSIAVEPLLDAILNLMPNTDEVILVGGDTTFDRNMVQEARKIIEAGYPLEVTELIGGTPESISERLSQREPGAVVLFMTYFKDETGVTRIPRKVVEKISSESAVPVFAFFDTMMGSGVVGVATKPFVEQGKLLGGIIERIAGGESPEEIGILPEGPPRLLFDDRAFRRYKLDSKKLPPGAEVRFERPGLIESHPIAFAVGTGTILIQTLLIIARREPKGAPWKAKIARELRTHTTTGNPWIAKRLNMGHPSRVTNLIREHSK